ncbi:hypothetical protein HY623_01130 [Candidatus Uhrbacteria bacterium]|nr:hypothetical protein [Candidatus Uhrbacteria bacterium]
MPKKQPGPESAGDGQESFEQAPMGGDIKTGRKTGETKNENQYFALIRDMRARADSVSLDIHEHAVTRSVKRPIRMKDKRYYVDAIISARPTIDPGGGHDYDSAIYVHSYAVHREVVDEMRFVDQMRDEKYVARNKVSEPMMESANDIGGYVIQISLPDPVSFFVNSRDHNVVRRLHREIVRMSEKLATLDAERVADMFSDRHVNDLASDGDRLISEREYMVLPDPPYESPHEKRYPLTE